MLIRSEFRIAIVAHVSDVAPRPLINFHFKAYWSNYFQLLQYLIIFHTYQLS